MSKTQTVVTKIGTIQVPKVRLNARGSRVQVNTSVRLFADQLATVKALAKLDPGINMCQAVRAGLDLYLAKQMDTQVATPVTARVIHRAK